MTKLASEYRGRKHAAVVTSRTDNQRSDGAAPTRFVMIAFDSMDKATAFIKTQRDDRHADQIDEMLAFIVEGL